MTAQQALQETKRWITEQHGQELESFCTWLALRKIHNTLEIGVRNGGTCGVWHKMSTGLVIGVDLVQGVDVPAGFCEERHRELVAHYPRFRSVLGDSHDWATREIVAELLKGEKVDLLFLDGDHSADGVRRDLELYRPLVSENGVIAFHDIVDTELTRRVNCRVCEVWKELEGAKIEFLVGDGTWGGIGALVV